MTWMIILGVVLVLGLLFWMFSGGSKLHAEHQARFEKGIRAMATVTRVEQPGAASHSHGTIVVRVFVTVEPPAGAPYAAVTGVRTQSVHIPRVQPGEKLAVRIATENPQLVYPDVEWGEMELVTITRAARGRYNT